MLDEKDLQAISKLLAESEQRIMNNMQILLDTEVKTRFDLLAEGQSLILEKLTTADDLEEIHDALDVHGALLKKHSRDIRALKKAN